MLPLPTLAPWPRRTAVVLGIAALAVMAATPLGASGRPATSTSILALEGSDIVWTIEVDPPEPTVGDSVFLSATASGVGFIPVYYLSLDPEGESAPLVVVSSPDQDPYTSLGFPAVWKLMAVRGGEATLSVAVHYDKPVCEEDPPGCFPLFFWVDADPVVIDVAPAVSPVGGVGIFTEGTAAHEWAGGAGGIAGVALAASVAGAIALGGAAWYGRRRWAR